MSFRNGWLVGLTMALPAFSVFDAFAGDTDPLGGKGLIYELTLDQPLELGSTHDGGATYFAAFHDGANIAHPVKFSDDPFFGPVGIEFCWFEVDLGQRDFEEYVSTHQYPHLVLDPIRFELQESASLGSAELPNGSWKMEQVDFLLDTPGSPFDLMHNARFPVRRTDGKPTDSTVGGFSCRGSDLRTTAVRSSTKFAWISNSRKAF
ncbi:MAG: hypothetical protein ACXWPM_12790 [Bdellovibrionota bacterium]